MTQDTRGLLDVLKAELELLEKGGYLDPVRANWRPEFIFQDSPTCLNFKSAQPPRPCSDCILMQLLPEDLRSEKIPCRYIPLSEHGETIDSFYRSGTQEELQAAVAQWLKTMIARLERGKSEGCMFSVCANPNCHAIFDYRQGRLFRFRKDHVAAEKASSAHSVQHFWLCGVCCGVYALEYRDGRSVLIKDPAKTSDNLETRLAFWPSRT
jgi:hypothetical protein